MNNDNDLNLHLYDQMSRWLRLVAGFTTVMFPLVVMLAVAFSGGFRFIPE